jgi:hypothetical protein
MTDASRTQGWSICIGAAVLGLLFLIGILSESYWALAVPVAILVFFALGLIGWVGYTIATVRVEPELQPEPPGAEPEPASPRSSASHSSSG